MLKDRLMKGEALIGSYVTLPSPEIVEILGAAGMDYAIIDLQHSSPDWQCLAHMIRAGEARGIAPLVRTHDQSASTLLKLLEMGAEAILLPGLRNAAQLKTVADAVFYPPLGARGACGHTRVAGYNPDRTAFPSHMRAQNDRIWIWAFIEHAEAIDQIGAIAEVVPGATAIGLGRGDLAVSMGLPGQVDHPDVVAATEAAIQTVADRSEGRCFSSVMVNSKEDIIPWFNRGARLFTFKADAVMLMTAAQDAVGAFQRSLAEVKPSSRRLPSQG
jgi:2-keto-3-deoxy-L-rhamnonate aldolase RhmA